MYSNSNAREGVVNYSGQIYSNDAVGYLRLASRTTRHPIEPLSPGKFAIGSDVGCQLRLGEDGIPGVHTILDVEADCVHVRCVVSEPQLLVNGQPAQQCDLHDGDLVEIGTHRMLLRLLSADGRIPLDEDAFVVTAEVEAAEASAEQLVDRLGEQLDVIEELANGADVGVEEMIAAAAAESPTEQSQQGWQRVEQLLQQQQSASRERLESLTEVLNDVVRQQKLIADTLEVLSDRVQSFSSTPYRRDVA